MPPQPSLKIAEIFDGIQGEGLRAGLPAVFIRLAGCNLSCPFCDTKTAWRGGRTLPVSAVLEKAERLAKSRPDKWVCLTGGEPFAQDIGPLVRRLRGDGFGVQVETNGTIPGLVDVDWVTVSPKPPLYEVREQFRKHAREVKLVVSRELTLAVIARVRGEFPPDVPVFLQPESNLPESRTRAVRLLRRTIASNLTGIRLGVQLHRVYGLR